MRSFPFALLLSLAAAACAQQSTQSAGPATAQDTLEARLDAADCLELRVAMREALTAQGETQGDAGATVQPQSGDVDLETGRPQGIASLLIPIPLGTIGRAVEGDEDSAPPQEMVDSETVYRRAHETYERKGCEPPVPYGEY